MPASEQGSIEPTEIREEIKPLFNQVYMPRAAVAQIAVVAQMPILEFEYNAEDISFLAPVQDQSKEAKEFAERPYEVLEVEPE